MSFYRELNILYGGAVLNAARDTFETRHAKQVVDQYLAQKGLSLKERR